jgi:hypothetical protein
MTTGNRPADGGAGRAAALAPSRRGPRALGPGARLRRDRSLVADAQRRFSAAAAARAAPAPGEAAAELSPQAESGGALPAPAPLTPLTQQARALYEGGVVPVRALARICGVSVAGLYYHVRRQGWRRRRSAVARDQAKAQRQRQRYLARKALRPPRPRGLKARDPAGEAQALAAARQAAALAGAALGQAIARQDAEARARMLAILTGALRALRAADGGAPRPARGARKPRKPAADWQPMKVSPLPRFAPPAPEPLSDKDRRINEIAARFYARRGGEG